MESQLERVKRRASIGAYEDEFGGVADGDGREDGK